MSVGPIVFTAQSDQFIKAAHIASVLWEGATVSGDRVELCEGIYVGGVLRGTGNLLWPCRTDSQQTYLGKTFGAKGLSAPSGFHAKILTAGRLLVYLKEA